MKRLAIVGLCVSALVGCGSGEVGSSAAYVAPAGSNAELVSTTIPSVMTPGETRLVSVTMRNTGATAGANDWLPFDYRLRQQNPKVVSWLHTRVASTVPVGNTNTFTFSLTAPSAPGVYTFRAQMYATSGHFGELVSVDITVDAAATAAFDADVASQTIPTRVTAGRSASFTIGFTNTGTEAWVGTDFRVRTANSPATLWGTTQRSLASGETIAPGATKSFTFGVFAPATPGLYDSRWSMFRSAGAFGDVAVTTGIEVTLCGNDVIDAGENCDDGNLNAGDGCSDTCNAEQRIVDLATDPADSTLFGRRDGVQLGLVGTGDVTGDGVVDLFTSERQSPVGIAPSRSGAGTVYAMHGGAGFFSGVSTAPTGTFVQISGAEANDGLGRVGRGFLRAGDVTGDGTADLVVGSHGGDGPANARVDCGEVYVFAGGAALASAGLVDLAADPAPAVLTATIFGAAAGDFLQVLEVADVTADGTPDLILSAPLADSNGTDSGTVYIVEGGPALVGTIDLDAPGAVQVYTMTGAPGDQIGVSAAVGNFGGSGAWNDLIIGAPDASPSGRTRAGKVYGLYGPVRSNGNIASLASVTWLGRNNNETLGSALAIGQFGGNGVADVMIGAAQWQRSPGTQAGAVLVWLGGIASGTTFDLTSATANAVILGADQGDTAGQEVAFGDMNGDGFGDLLIGAPTADGPDGSRDRSGEAYVVFGRGTLPATLDLAVAAPNVVVYAAGAIDLLGRSGTLALVDVDGDGLADPCIGSYRGGPVREGRLDCLQSNF